MAPNVLIAYCARQQHALRGARAQMLRNLSTHRGKCKEPQKVKDRDVSYGCTQDLEQIAEGGIKREADDVWSIWRGLKERGRAPVELFRAGRLRTRSDCTSLSLAHSAVAAAAAQRRHSERFLAAVAVRTFATWRTPASLRTKKGRSQVGMLFYMHRLVLSTLLVDILYLIIVLYSS
eukprot:3060321-Pleurochrysis_carterae.AAC.3